MQFKELSFPPDIRLCVYHVGAEPLDFHRHAEIADITYCAAGRLVLELPESGVAHVFLPGQLVQVPRGAIHRVSHAGDAAHGSTYVLLQLGRFSIDFVPPPLTPGAAGGASATDSARGCTLGAYRPRVAGMADQLRRTPPPALTATEQRDVLAALDTVLALARPVRDEA